MGPLVRGPWLKQQTAINYIACVRLVAPMSAVVVALAVIFINIINDSQRTDSGSRDTVTEADNWLIISVFR